MELPKNITQIGEVNPFCKIYVEDYVISYLKQLNQVAVDKDLATALYGEKKTEGDITYLFLFGACKLDFLQKETRHLSQAQKQEIEKLRRRYFPEYEFLGYRLLNGEMIEGFYICEQDICRYIEGYAQFYEKNDKMLAYMLDTREQVSAPEVVDSGKYEEVKRRQEARREQTKEEGGWKRRERGSRSPREIFRGEDRQQDSSRAYQDMQSSEEVFPKEVSRGESARKDNSGRREATYREEASRRAGAFKREVNRDDTRYAKLAAAVVFAVLCIAGISGMKDSVSMEGLQTAARDAVSGVMEQKLPDVEAVDGQAVSSQGTGSVLTMEEKLAEALQKENQQASGQAPEGTGQPAEGQSTPNGTETQTAQQPGADDAGNGTVNANPSGTEGTAPSGQETSELSGTQTSEASPQPIQSPEPTPASTPEPTPEPQPVSYTIRRGDTLIGICLRNYGSDVKVAEICELNQIANPDDIKVGQKILLPQ